MEPLNKGSAQAILLIAILILLLFTYYSEEIGIVFRFALDSIFYLWNNLGVIWEKAVGLFREFIALF